MISGNLFTRDYLLEGITRSEPWTALADSEVASIQAGLLKHVQSLLAIHKPNEAQTEKVLIYPVLELLGWSDVEVQQTLSTKGRKQVPDALLFGDTASRNRAVAEKDQWKRYQHGLAITEAMDRLTKWGGQLLINEPMQKAMAQALAMQKLERVNDIDIAEVHQSKTLFDGIEQETRPLNSFIKILYALEWLKLDKADETAVRAWLDGQFGDPFEIARGRFTLGPSDPGDGHIQPKNVIDQVAAPMRANAERFAVILNKARALVRAEKFQNWQVAYPGVWTQWESGELHGGFHAVVGNPPYVRHELIKPYKPQLKRGFPATYDGSADLYVYFYDQGMKLLMPGGRLSYVVTNKWMRAGYAEGLRGMFADKAWVEFVADFGHAKNFFPDADVFPSVIVVRKPVAGSALAETQVCVIPRDDVPEKALSEAVVNATYPLPRAHFTKENWTLEPPNVVELLAKIKRNGRALKEFAGIEPYYGIKTGLNEAFLIDTQTRNKLVSTDPKVGAIIKPYLRGQDVNRWACPDTGLFMIAMKSSENFSWPWSNASNEGEAEQQFSREFPSLFEHFKSLEEFRDKKTGKTRGLRHREDQGRFWWELRSCSYYDAFEKSKIIYQVIQFYARYCLDLDGRLSNDKAFFLPTDDPWLIACLNSPLMWWHNWRHLTHLKDEALSPMGYKVSILPIAAPSAASQDAVTKHVADLVARTKAASHATLSTLDWLRHEFELVKPGRELANLTALDAEGFISAVRSALPKKRKLTAAEISELKREHGITVEPARQARAEIFGLEQQLSELVNEAYGLTPNDVDLMWRTAPPRMPFTPAGLTDGLSASDQDDSDDE